MTLGIFNLFYFKSVLEEVIRLSVAQICYYITIRITQQGKLNLCHNFDRNLNRFLFLS